MLFFTFIKGGGHPLTGPPNLNGFSLIIRGGGKSLLTNVNKKMFFFNKGFHNVVRRLQIKYLLFMDNAHFSVLFWVLHVIRFGSRENK